MSTIEIPRPEWPEFFRTFSEQHEGWLVTVEILGADVGDQVEVRQLPFHGIDFQNGNQRVQEIEITAGRASESHITRRIIGPSRIWLKKTPEGADEVLEVATQETTALIRFRSAVMPETVDGLAS